MGRWRLIQRAVIFVAISFLFFNVAFSAINDSPISPELLLQEKSETAWGNRIEKKISGQLRLHMQLRTSYVSHPTSERVQAMQKMGLKTIATEMDRQLIYIHVKRKLSAYRVKSLKKTGVVVYEDSWIPPLKNHPTGYVMASVPVSRLYDLAAKTYIIKLETAERVLLPKNDEASKSTHADDVWNDYGYDGSGVRIAVLDSGLDTTHKDIPIPVVSKDYSDYPNLDNTIENLVTEHGTHVSGSAVGRGIQSNGKYRGMAFGADLIFLKVGDDSTGGASEDVITMAIKDAVDIYSADIITMSYGGFAVYNDGSEEICQAADYAFSKGALVFMAGGNEADAKTHYSGTVAAHKKTKFIQVNVQGTGAMLYFYLDWFDGKGISNDLRLSLYNANKRKISSKKITKYREGESTKGTEAELVFYNSYVSGPATYYLKVKNNSVSDQFFHIYSFDYTTTFTKADPNYTVLTPATADNVLAVASYVTRPIWTNYKGYTFGYIKDITIGEVSSFSSRGPRIDGIKKPDIAAPGQGIISARDKIITWPGGYDALVIDNDGINNGNGPADYFLLQGTSMAAPVAAGASALLMQASPSLKGKPGIVREALLQSASNAGEQSNTDGYGKMDVLAALNFLISTKPLPMFTPIVTPAPNLTPRHVRF
ncbi:MAG: S8 family serine peptidase [Planctomycetia bacterium]|nr:S8 family serine peptidase [Planctomycetia bacterium]